MHLAASSCLCRSGFSLQVHLEKDYIAAFWHCLVRFVLSHHHESWHGRGAFHRWCIHQLLAAQNPPDEYTLGQILAASVCTPFTIIEDTLFLHSSTSLINNRMWSVLGADAELAKGGEGVQAHVTRELSWVVSAWTASQVFTVRNNCWKADSVTPPPSLLLSPVQHSVHTNFTAFPPYCWIMRINGFGMHRHIGKGWNHFGHPSQPIAFGSSLMLHVPHKSLK